MKPGFLVRSTLSSFLALAALVLPARLAHGQQATLVARYMGTLEKTAERRYVQPEATQATSAANVIMFNPAEVGVSANSAQTPAKTASQRSRIADSYGRLPLSFEVNRGQADKRVKFLARGKGYGVFLTGQGAVLALHASPSGDSGTLRDRLHQPSPPKTDVLQMQLLGANPSAEPHGADQLSGAVNYFRGNDPSRWQSRIPTFAKVEFTGVYPGIDLVYYGNQGQLEYDFAVAPNVDPAIIRLHFAGARQLRLAATGDLTVRAKNGRIAFHKPAIYQEENGRRRPVQGRFTLLADNSVGFALGDYDHSRPLVIDPTLIYSTYLGGSTSDEAVGIEVDASGNAYITGTTSSADFPATAGSYQTTIQKSPGNTQPFISKLNPTGTALIYSTYLGGTSDDDHANGIAVDAAGNAYITGYAQSSDFPTTAGAFQTTRKSSGGTGFVSKLNPTGTGLVYSTYLGGSFGQDQGAGIAVDSSGDAYVAGSTQAADFPVTAGAFATTLPGHRAAFVTKLNPAGTALIYSTFLGGTGYDSALAIALDASGNAYVVGGASSVDFPVTASAFQKTSLTSPNGTGFVAKLNAVGSALVYSTYLGGSSLEQVKAIAVDASGTAYVAGHTNSADFPVTSGAFQGASHSGAGFVTHLNATGSALVYSTFLGPASNQSEDGPHGIRVDSTGEAYVTGQSLPGFPVTPNAFQSTCSSLTAAYVTRLNVTGTALVYSTCLGGTRGTFGNAIAIDAAGHAFVAGGTNSTDFPVSSGAFQTTDKTASIFARTGFVTAFDTNPAAAGTTTALTSSANPATLGQNVTFDAAVDTSSGSTTPTGNVVFNIDATDVATVTLAAGGASYQTTTLTAGSHTVKATYQGDTGFSSSSDTITETIQSPPTAATPVISPGSGTFTSSQQVTITDATAGSTIYYTADGSAPSSASTQYTGAVTVSSSETIKAIATASGYSQSATATATYTIVAPAVTLTPSSVAFGNQTVNTTSGSQTVTLNNSGGAALSIASIVLTGANATSFAQTNNCPASLAAGASCNISITFAPASIASYSAAVTVTDNASGSPHTVALTGSGTAPPAPIALLTPASLNFGSVGIGSTSAAQVATLKNTGNAALTISGIAITGANPADFAQANGCGASLAPGISCSISVTFTPASIASLTAQLIVTDNATGSPHKVALSGAGIAQPPAFSISPTSLAFGDQVVDSISGSKMVTLTNTSTTDTLSIPSAQPSDPAFYSSGSCPATIAPGGSCHLVMVFNPKAVQSYSAIVTLQVAGVSCFTCSYPTQTFTVTGTGTPIMTVSPATLDLGNQSVNSTSAQKTVTLTNNSATDTVVEWSFDTGNPVFTYRLGGCVAPIPPGGKCSVAIDFTPTAIQSYSATASFQMKQAACGGSCATYPVQTFTITGAGVPVAPVMSVSPATLDFGNQSVNSTSAQKTVTLTNTSATDTVVEWSFDTGNPVFTYRLGGCVAPIPPGGKCSVAIDFTPAAIQSYTATASFQMKQAACGGSCLTYPVQTFTITGAGIAQPPAFTIAPTSIDYGSVIVGQTLMKNVTLTNTSDTAIAILSISSSDSAFDTILLDSHCGTQILAGASCTAAIPFTPTAVKNYSATISLQDLRPVNCGGCTRAYPAQSITVTGTGIAPVASLSPTSLNFSTTMGTTSAAQTATLSNNGTAPLTISSISLAGNPDKYHQTNNCPFSLDIGATCAISVAFSPEFLGSYSATITVTDNDASSQQTIALNGNSILTPDFVIRALTPAQSILPGGSAQFALTVTAQNGATIPAVSLAATGLPPGATATFSQSAVTPGSTSATSTLTIQTAARVAAATGSAWPLAAPALALVGLFFVPGKRRRRLIVLGVLLIASLGAVSTLSGCGGGFSLLPPAKSYTVTITGTIGAVQQTSTVQLTVQ